MYMYLHMDMCMYLLMFFSIYMSIYLYIYIFTLFIHLYVYMSSCICLCPYIYIYITIYLYPYIPRCSGTWSSVPVSRRSRCHGQRTPWSHATFWPPWQSQWGATGNCSPIRRPLWRVLNKLCKKNLQNCKFEKLFTIFHSMIICTFKINVMN